MRVSITYKKSILAATCFLFALSGVLAQPNALTFGQISGRIIDSETGDPIPSASIMLLEDSSYLLKSDLDGNFRFFDVPVGTYTVRVFKSAYRPYDVSNTIVTEGEVSKLTVPLPKRQAASAESDSTTGESSDGEEDIFNLAAFEVTAEVVQNTEVGLLQVRQRATTIGDAIGSDFISRAGSSDAAEAVSKIVGANIVDGKFAVIRGLGDRYSNTLLNGAVLPSNDPSKKSVQLDIIPADLLEEINTAKTFTPDRPGDFTGGSVNISTKSFPDEFLLKATLSTSYNDQVTGEDILIIPGQSLDFLGKIDGGLPGVIPSTPLEFNILNSQLLADKLSAYEALHAPGFFPSSTSADPAWGMAISVGDSKPLFKTGKFGYVLSFTRDSNFSHTDDKIIQRFTGVNAENPKSGYEVTESTEEVAWGMLFNLAVQWNPLNEISYNLIHNQIGQNKVALGDNGFDVETQVSSAGRDVRSRDLPANQAEGVEFLRYGTLSHTLRKLRSHQVKGKHVFDHANNFTIEWITSLSDTEEDIPLEWGYSNLKWVYPDGTFDELWITENPRYPSRTFGNLQDSKDSYQIDFTLPIRTSKLAAWEIKTGILQSDADRVSLQRIFKYDWSLALPGRDSETRFGLHDRFEEDVWFSGNVPGYRNSLMTIDEDTTSSGNARSYLGAEKIQAGYLMTDLEFTDWFRVIGGARIETTDMSVEAIEEFVNPALIVGGRDRGQIVEEDVLPAAHAIFTIGKESNMNIRASYGKTLARPTFREFSPFRSIDTQSKETVEGNPQLDRTLVDNFDLRWEWFYDEGEIIAFSVYYKDFQNPIVSTVDTRPNDIYSWTNVPSGEIMGFELEFRTILFDHLLVGGNFSYIDSAIDPIATGGSGTVFEGQPEFIFNFNFGYDLPDYGITANLFFNYVDDTLRFVGESGPDIYSKGRSTIDFNISKSFGDFVAKLSLKNLLNEKNTLYYEAPESPTYEAYSSGRSLGLSVAYTY